MKRVDFKAVICLIGTYFAVFGLMYILWTGASYLFINGRTTKANMLDIVMIAIVGWYVTRDIFYVYYKSRRCKHGINKNLSPVDNKRHS